MAFSLAACAPTTALHDDGANKALTSNQDDFAYGILQATIREGLKNITQRYIEPIEMRTLAISGIRGIATIDPSLSLKVRALGTKIELFQDETSLKHFTTPKTNDPTAWAHLASDVVRTARAQSLDMSHSDNERIFEAVFDGMMSNLDIFSRYAGGNEARAHRAQRDGFGGIGINFTKANDGFLVTHISPKSPAHRAGLKPGDLIVQIEGTPITTRSQFGLENLLHGPVGSLISITIERLPSVPGKNVRRISYNLERSHIVPQTVHTSVNHKILTVRITSFNKNTSTSVHSALSAHEADFSNGTLIGVILDLRGNPGGLLSQSINVADFFLKKGTIISTRGRHSDSVHDYQAGSLDLSHGKPLVVLLDGNSASAAEVVASALQDLGRAALIGSTSYGKGTVQTVVRLPNDGEITLTWSRLISPTGYALHDLGVMPSVCATNAVQTVGESLPDAILTPLHIKTQREAMTGWWATGQVFDDQRRKLRDDCPAKIFESTPSSDLLLQLAERVLGDPALYQHAVLKPNAVNTASRQ